MLNFNWLFLKPNQFICNKQSVPSRSVVKGFLFTNSGLFTLMSGIKPLERRSLHVVIRLSAFAPRVIVIGVLAPGLEVRIPHVAWRSCCRCCKCGIFQTCGSARAKVRIRSSWKAERESTSLPACLGHVKMPPNLLGKVKTQNFPMALDRLQLPVPTKYFVTANVESALKFHHLCGQYLGSVVSLVRVVHLLLLTKY